MVEDRVRTTDADIEAAREQAKAHDGGPVALRVKHIANVNALLVELSNHRRLLLPVEDLQGLEHATARQLEDYELLGGGTGISFPALDADFYVPALIEGVYGSKRWMEALNGRTQHASAA